MENTFYFHEKYGQLGKRQSYFIKNGSEVIGSRDCKKTSGSKSAIVWFVEWLRYAFLPQGYPASVSSDYLSYQLWDTLQV